MKGLLKVSLAANVLFCAFLIYVTKAGKPQSPNAESSNSPEPAASAPGPRPFHWRQLESTDYRVYIANLRGIGCPEQTVRDIIAADVDSQYSPRRQQLQNHATSPAALEFGLRSLQKEEINLLNSLLGIQPASTNAEKSVSSEIAQTAHPRRKSPLQDNVTLPLAMRNVDVGTLNLTGSQIEALTRVRDDFVNTIGGAGQDPNDPEYRKRWQNAQPGADDMLRGLLGTETFLQMEQQAVNQKSASR